MYFLWIKCRCGAEGDFPIEDRHVRMTRDEILSLAICQKCRTRSAVDMRRYWNPSANALDGALVRGQGPERDG
jgi:hypothetical protein